MNIKPIKNQNDYTQALERLEVIFEAKKGPIEGDELEVLSILIENYEDKHFPNGFPGSIKAIKLECYKQRDLAKVVGLKIRASEILNRKRKLSLDMIGQLRESFNISTDVLIQAY